jgi:hypothetical protein
MRYLLLVLCTTLLSLNSFARFISPRNPLDGVLDADLVVIMRRSPVDENGKLFMVLETFWGDAKFGDSIDLGDFKLRIPQQYGDDIVEPITSETFILFFLQRSSNSPKRWQPTDYRESYFWVQNPQDYALLELAAQRAVVLRRQWEHAARIPDLKQRVAALWPFWSFEYGVSFSMRTKEQLKKITSPEFFDTPFPEDSNYPRSSDYLTGEWHKNVRARLEERGRAYQEFVAASAKASKDVDGEKRRETETQLVRGISSGIYKLSAARNPDDLPLIREMALLSAEYHQDRIAYAALSALSPFREKMNLPAIEVLLNAFRPDYKPGTWKSVVWKAEKLVCDYRYVETVPLLAPFVADESTGRGAQFCLQEIVGFDLGQSPKAWIDWYQSESKATSTISWLHGWRKSAP